MHQFAYDDRLVLGDVASWIADRAQGLTRDQPTRGGDLPGVQESGIGIEATWAVLRDGVFPTVFPTDHPRYLAFVGGAPSPASIIADAALSAAAVYGGSELEAGRVVEVERAALRWLCDIVGFDPEAGGAFVSGGSAATLSALVAARHGRRTRSGRAPSVVVAGAAAHSSVAAAASIMGCSVILSGSRDGPWDGRALSSDLRHIDPDDLVGVVATAGATNTGAIDRLEEIAEVCDNHSAWLHVDAAYGGAALLAPSTRDEFSGIERADSITIDPHKWLFTPLDCASVLYREPRRARDAHRQHADYLAAVNGDLADNPSDYSVQLTRRARGLPLWASLVANGAAAYTRAVEKCLTVARRAAQRIEASPVLELVAPPQLSVVLFRRRGWQPDDYAQWSEQARRNGLALLTPTVYAGETVLRLCFVNPHTTDADVEKVLCCLESQEAAQ